MEGTANTIGYFIAGYAVIFGIMGIYLVSLVVRMRSLHQDERMLVEFERKVQEKASTRSIEG
jgi:hypothetical protein